MSESSLYPTALDSSNIYEVVARLSTTLTADITAATTTIPLASTTGFPTKGNIVINNETIAYISVSVGSVDATGGRGKAGTAASHLNTTQVLCAVTATDFNKLRAGLIAVQTYIGISGSTNSAFITTAPLLKSKIITATRDMAALDGDVSYTGLDFTPTSIKALGAIASTEFFCNGFADSSKAQSNISQGSAGSFSLVNASLLTVYAAGGGAQTAVLKSYDANVGFTLTWSKWLTPTGTINLSFLCFR